MTKKTIHHFLILAVAPFLAFAAPAAASDDRGTPEEAQDMVSRAIAYYDEMGPEAALAKFNTDPAPEFLDRDLYIFVYGPDGWLVAHGVDPALLGRTYSSFTDVDGKQFGLEMQQTASVGGTWVDYKWMNPATGEVEQKSTWMVLHDDHHFGVGIYKP